MAPVHQDAALLLAEHKRSHVLGLRGGEAQGDVHRGDPVRRPADREPQFPGREVRVGPQLGEALEHAGSDQLRRDPQESDLDGAPAGPREGTRRCGGLRFGIHRLLGLLIQPGAGGCQRDAARVADEQVHADLPLELQDRRGERRLGDLQRRRRARDLPGLRRAHEVDEMTRAEVGAQRAAPASSRAASAGARSGIRIRTPVSGPLGEHQRAALRGRGSPDPPRVLDVEPERRRAGDASQCQRHGVPALVEADVAQGQAHGAARARARRLRAHHRRLQPGALR